MVNSVWDGGARDSVNSRGGLKTIGSYSGLYRPENDRFAVYRHDSGNAAIERIRETTRLSLNEGEEFSGYLEEWEVSPLRFWVGTHAALGFAVHAQIPASYTENRIEVHHGDGKQSTVMKRADFFGKLLVVHPAQQDADRLFSGLSEHLAVHRNARIVITKIVAKTMPPPATQSEP